MAILTKKSEALVQAAARSASNDIKRKAAGAYGDTRENMVEFANETGQKVREAISQYSEDIEHTREVLEETIRSKPVQSVAVALAAGVVLGLLIRR